MRQPQIGAQQGPDFDHRGSGPAANPALIVHTHHFCAMGSPCEVQVESNSADEALHIGKIAEAEAKRIEHKFSRYRNDSAISAINATGGKLIIVDSETASLIDYAAACHAMSGGLFDITSGILRRAWTFDGSDNVPDPTHVKKLLAHVGWTKVAWKRPGLTLPLGMEIDLGGLGKEYAVDRAIALIRAASDAPTLINFGGDLAVTGPRANGARWRVLIDGLDESEQTQDTVNGAGGAKAAWLEVADGAVTTSGDSRRYLLRDGVRYGHILDPRTGYPVKDAPRAVTVAAPTCLEAGVLSTLAMLKGAEAEVFLRDESINAWVTR